VDRTENLKRRGEREEAMQEQSNETLIQRIARVERENCYWKVLGSVAIATLGLVLLLGATSDKLADEIRAKRFVLIDGNGTERAKLSEETDGEVRLTLSDKKGKVRAGLSVGADGSSRLTLYHTNQEGRAGLRLNSEGSPSLLLDVPSKKATVKLGVLGEPYGRPIVGLTDHDGNSLYLRGDGLLVNDKLKERIWLFLEPDGPSALKLWDEDGKLIWEAP
jgi:hypothetical protein